MMLDVEERVGPIWALRSFEVMTGYGPKQVQGFTYQGLGLYDETPAINLWSVVHLNTGTAICRIASASPSVAMFHAQQLAELIDWSFTDETGWKAKNPDLPQKLATYAKRWKVVRLDRLDDIKRAYRSRS